MICQQYRRLHLEGQGHHELLYSAKEAQDLSPKSIFSDALVASRIPRIPTHKHWQSGTCDDPPDQNVIREQVTRMHCTCEMFGTR